jgi:hypothetical protein
VRRAVARAYDGDYGANVTVLVVEPGGLRALDPPNLTESQSAQRTAVLEEVKKRANDGVPPTPADRAGNGTAEQPVPSGVWVPPLRSDQDRLRVLMDFGQHGREFITSEVGLRLLEVLAATGSDAPDRAAADAALAKAAGVPLNSPRLRRLRAVLGRLSLVILPLENEGGRARVEQGARCERKNGRGVDPNRNWPLDWGRKEPDYDPAEEFPGRAPGSEPETRVVRALTSAFKPHAWVNVHSGMQALFTAYDHVARVPQGEAAKAALSILHRLNARACSSQCAVGSGGKSVGYLAHGTATDHMYVTERVPLAFTWEIYGDESAGFDDCFRMFNPLGREAFDKVVSDWVKASLAALELLPTHPEVGAAFFAGAGGAGGKEGGGKEGGDSEASLRALFVVDAGKEPEEAAEAAEAELKAAALQAESAKAEAAEERKRARGKGGAAAAAKESGSSSSSSSSSSSLPRRMGPQRQQHELADGDAAGDAGAAATSGGGGGGAATVALVGITAAGAGARLFAVLPLLLVFGVLSAVAVALARRQRRERAGYLPTTTRDDADDDGGFGFGPVARGGAAGGGAGGGGISLVGVVGRRP